MIALFTILTIVFVIGRVIMGYFADSFELIATLLPAMTWIPAILGSVAGVFILIKVCGAIKDVVTKVKNKDKE